MRHAATLSILVTALLMNASALAATYPATLNCEAALTAPNEPAFSAPVTLKVDATTLAWSRESTAMREVVSGTIIDGKVNLDGYGGSVSAATRQAFWDWKLAAQLVVASDGVAGSAQLLSKDGRVVQRRCAVTTAGSPKPGLEVPASAKATVAEPTVVEPKLLQPQIPVAPPSPPSAKLNAPPTVLPTTAQSSANAEQAAAREAGMRRREEVLSRREQSVAKREKAVAQQQPKAPLATPAAPNKPAVPPASPQHQGKTSNAPVLGDI